MIANWLAIDVISAAVDMHDGAAVQGRQKADIPHHADDRAGDSRAVDTARLLPRHAVCSCKEGERADTQKQRRGASDIRAEHVRGCLGGRFPPMHVLTGWQALAAVERVGEHFSAV